MGCRDVFAERGLRPPATWHEYLHLAGQLHGQAMPVSPDSNSTIAGWCESFPTGCSYDGITLTAIWTSFVARQGPQAGAFFDPQVRYSHCLLRKSLCIVFRKSLCMNSSPVQGLWTSPCPANTGTCAFGGAPLASQTCPALSQCVSVHRWCVQTMSPRLAGAGMAESIRVFRELHEFELEPHPPDCLRNSLELILQRCALFPAVRCAASRQGAGHEAGAAWLHGGMTLGGT